LFGFLTTIAFNEARYLAGKATRDVDKLYSYAEFLGDKIPGAETSKDYDD
jgi:hypothetical protein